MSIRYLAPLFLACAAPAVQAHEVWIERDASGPARIYLGEPAEALPVGGDPEFEHLKAPKLVPASKAVLARKTGYLEVAVPSGDVRAHDDTVFAPWGTGTKKEGVAYYARAGRSEARAVMPMELTPVTAGSDRFVLVRDGQPVKDTQITVVSPEKWSKSVKTDADGAVAVPIREKGRYLISATLKDEGKFDTTLGPVSVLHRVATTTFVVD
ncbi:MULTISPECIES: DUF4198 domain-containing protein [unclassified Novosphingobium]|uniref:DUF4198 domain-containing protein n=1 Tax=unclassified Novosphingobium TaxID=2644732 RepID=UPI001357032A|nr:MULTISPECIES: DUF4198 domain-containing protein [unclassified Novosphingobium]